MTERVIRITRDLYESLPALYQSIAKIGEQSGKVVIVDEQDMQCNSGCGKLLGMRDCEGGVD